MIVVREVIVDTTPPNPSRPPLVVELRDVEVIVVVFREIVVRVTLAAGVEATGTVRGREGREIAAPTEIACGLRCDSLSAHALEFSMTAEAQGAAR